MPAFDAIALQPAFPVIHSQRKDGTTLTAIRVPTNDVRLNEWGWILTLSHKGQSTDQDDIKRLNDNDGQRYPKIYTIKEVYRYIEEWQCHEWEAGYYGDDNKIHSRRITTPLNTNMLQEDMIQATLDDIKTAQTEQLSILINEFAVQARDIRDEFRAKNADVQELLQTQFLSIQGNVNRLLTVNEELGKQFVTVDTCIKESTVQVQEKTIEEAKNYLIQACEEIQKRLDNINARIETQFSAGQEKLHQEILSQARITGEETKKQLDVIDDEIKLQLAQVQANTIKAVHDRIIPFWEDSQGQLEDLNNAIKEQFSQSSKTFISEIINRFQLIESNNQRHLDSIEQAVNESLITQADQIKDLQEQIKKVLELTDPGIADPNKTNDEDIAAMAAKIAKRPTTRIERIAMNQLSIGKKYYDNVNEQSQRSFKIAMTLSIVGGIIFLTTFVLIVVLEALHITHDPRLLIIGSVVSSGIELLAGLNVIYDKATEQFKRFHMFLDRIMRFSIAHAMCEDIKNDDAKREDSITEIVKGLITNDYSFLEVSGQKESAKDNDVQKNSNAK